LISFPERWIRRIDDSFITVVRWKRRFKNNLANKEYTRDQEAPVRRRGDLVCLVNPGAAVRLFPLNHPKGIRAKERNVIRIATRISRDHYQETPNRCVASQTKRLSPRSKFVDDFFKNYLGKAGKNSLVYVVNRRMPFNRFSMIIRYRKDWV
jgi:hypothetical protein